MFENTIFAFWNCVSKCNLLIFVNILKFIYLDKFDIKAHTFYVSKCNLLIFVKKLKFIYLEKFDIKVHPFYKLTILIIELNFKNS